MDFLTSHADAIFAFGVLGVACVLHQLYWFICLSWIGEADTVAAYKARTGKPGYTFVLLVVQNVCAFIAIPLALIVFAKFLGWNSGIAPIWELMEIRILGAAMILVPGIEAMAWLFCLYWNRVYERQEERERRREELEAGGIRDKELDAFWARHDRWGERRS